MIHNPISYFNLYHGTTLENLSKILEIKEFTFITRDNHWLGNGVYFFVDDVDKALWWSKMEVRKPKVKDKRRGVIFVEGYKLHRNKLLDLDTEKDRNLMADFLKETPMKINLKLEIGNSDEEIIRVRSKIIDLIVIYFKISAVKYTFHKENLKSQKLLNKLDLSNNETQFCIIDTSTIDFENVYDITEEVI